MDTRTIPKRYRVVAPWLLAACCGIVGCGSGDDKERRANNNVLHYWVLLSGPWSDLEEDFADDETILFGGAEMGGVVTIKVNGSPVNVHTFGGSLFRISEWVTKGKNEVVVEGKHTKRMFVKVLTARQRDIHDIQSLANFKVQDVLGKSWLEVRQERTELTFDAVSQFASGIQRIPNGGEERNKAEQELRGVLTSLEKAIREHRGSAVSNMLYPSYPAWMELDVEATKKARNATASLIDDEECVLESSANDVKVIWGVRCVLVYAGQLDDLSETFYSFRGKTGAGVTFSLPKMHFVRISGKWRRW